MIDKVDFMTMEEKLSDKDLQDILIEYEYYQDGRLSEAPTSVVRSIRAESHSKGYLIDLSSHFEKGLTFLEFNYMVMQAYDFLELNRWYDCKLEMGGNDQ